MTDPTRPLALFFSIFFAIVFSARFYQGHQLLFLLLAIRYWLMSGFIGNRLPPERPILLHHRVLAYFSKFIPFFYRSPAPLPSHSMQIFADILGLAGTSLSTWALVDLGRRFGVSPAKRGMVCREGAYRWLSHPIYVGYAIVEIGAVLLNLANLPIFVISMGSLIWRASLENKVIQKA